MRAETERGRGVEVGTEGGPVNSAFLASTTSTSSRILRVLVPAVLSWWPRAGEHKQVIGDYPQPDPSLHPVRASVSTAPQPVPSFERANASLAAGAPAEGRPRQPRARGAGRAREHHVPHPAVPGRRYVLPRRESPIGHRKLRSVVEEVNVAIQRRGPQVSFRLPALTHLVVGDELALRFLDLHDAPELGGLGQFALADDLGVRLEETDDLPRKMGIAPQ